MQEGGNYGSMEQNCNEKQNISNDEIEEELYHYEAHESLEDEQFELHTQVNKDLADDQNDPYKYGEERELEGNED